MSSQTCTQSLVMSSLTHLHPTRITSSATSLEANCSEATHNFQHTILLFSSFPTFHIKYTPILLIKLATLSLYHIQLSSSSYFIHHYTCLPQTLPTFLQYTTKSHNNTRASHTFSKSYFLHFSYHYTGAFAHLLTHTADFDFFSS